MVKFAYAVGRIRAIEARMLDTGHILRMADAAGFESAFNILTDTHYSEKIDKLERAFDFETLFKLELEHTRELLLELAPQNELIEIIFAKYEPDLDDTHYLTRLGQAALKHDLPLFTKYARGFIALTTIKNKALKEKLDIEEMIDRYLYSDYGTAVKPGFEEFKKSGSLHVLEREIDNTLMEVIRRAKYLVFGIEPLLGYAIAKEIEVKNLRMIMVLKLMQVKTEYIKERIRNSYV